MSDAEALARHAVTCADGQYIGPYRNGFTSEWCNLVTSGSKRCAHPFANRVRSAAAPATSGGHPERQPSRSVVEPVKHFAHSDDDRASQPSCSAEEPGRQRPRSGADAAWQPTPSADGLDRQRETSDAAGEDVLVLDTSCEFHLLQGVGRFADRKFPAVAQFEKLLRGLKDELGDGASRLYLRGAARLLRKRVRALLAPKVDNFKVTLYSRGFHTRFLYNYDVVYKALAAKLSASYQNEQVLAWSRYEANLQAHKSRRQEPKPPTRARGLRVKVCRALRTLGQRMTDPFLVVFGVGRGDLRDTFLSAYATMTQNFRLSGLVKARCRQELCSAMRAGTQLAEMAGALRCLNYAANHHQPGSTRWKLGLKGIRLHIKVICAHLGWRIIPNVVRILPDILAHGDFDRAIMGMSIKPRSSPFLEPTPKKIADRAAHRSALRSSETPSWWWRRVLDALDQLVRLLRMEVIFFEQRLQAWDGELGDEGRGRCVSLSPSSHMDRSDARALCMNALPRIAFDIVHRHVFVLVGLSNSRAHVS